MQLRRRLVLFSLVVAAALGVSLAFAQGPAYRPPHRADGHPDLSGIWQAFVTANWDVQDHEAQSGDHPEVIAVYGAGPAGQSIVEGGEIPYRPEALAKKRDNFAKRMQVDVRDEKKWHALGDPELKCYMPGVPRAKIGRAHV